MCRRHAPEVFERVERDLRAGRITLRECIRAEFQAIRGDHAQIVDAAVDRAQVRAGFPDFVSDARAAGDEVVIVSSGFESVIRPVLERAGVSHVELIAHEVGFSPERTVVTFRHGDDVCGVCGEECKRSVVQRLDGGRPVVYVGDGYSDRCAALDADRRFARRSLARYLDERGVEYTPFDDFDQIRLALYRADGGPSTNDSLRVRSGGSAAPRSPGV